MRKFFPIHLPFIVVFLLILIFTYNGNIHFGNGLGDLAYIFLTAGISIVNFVMIVAFRQILSRNKAMNIVLLVVNILVLLYTVYSFTIGRGIERPWDGTVFF